jgi:hypothetical protein
MRPRFPLFALVLLVGWLSGCGKPRLEEVRSFEVGPVGHLVTVDPINREQKIQVTGTATGAPVNAYVYLEKNKTAAQNEILTKKVGSAILEKQDDTQTISLEAKIPANESAVVHITRAVLNKPSSVQLKITNR